MRLLLRDHVIHNLSFANSIMNKNLQYPSFANSIIHIWCECSYDLTHFTFYYRIIKKIKTLIVLNRQFIPFNHSHFPSILNLIFCVFFVWSSLNESWTWLRIGKKWLRLLCPTPATIGLVWFLKFEKWDKWVFEIWGLINWWRLHMFFLTENVLSIFC